jgi:hypothetical protein
MKWKLLIDKVTWDTETLVQFDTLFLIFLEVNLGLEMVMNCLDSFLNIVLKRLNSLQLAVETGDASLIDCSSTYQFFKGLLAFFVKCKRVHGSPLADAVLEHRKMTVFSFCLALLDPHFGVDTRMIACILTGSLLSYHSLLPVEEYLKILLHLDSNTDNSRVEQDQVARELQACIINNPHAEVMIIGGVLQCNPESLISTLEGQLSDLTSFDLLIKVFERLLLEGQYSTTMAMQIFSFQALGRWFNVVGQLLGREQVVKVLAKEVVYLKVVPIIIDRWEDPVVSQKILRELFMNLTLLVTCHPLFDDQLGVLLHELYSMETHRAKFELLSMLLPKIPLSRLNESCPNLFEMAVLNLEIPALTVSVVGFLVQFLVHVAAEPTMLQPFADRIVKVLASESPFVRQKVTEKLIPRVGASSKIFLDLVLRGLASADLENEFCLESLISVVGACKTLKHELDDNLLAEVKKIIGASVVSSNPRVRYNAFSYLIESIKGSTDLTRQDIQLFKDFVLFNGGGESGESRKQITSRLGHLLERVKRLLYKNIRDLEKLEKRLELFPQECEQIAKEKAFISDQYQLKMDFVHWLTKVSVLGLFPGSSISRAMSGCINLMLISEIDELIIDQTAILELPKLLKLTEFEKSILLHRLIFETIPSNKKILLNTVLEGSLSFELRHMANAFRNLLVSIRAADVDIASTLGHLIFNQCRSRNTRLDFLKEPTDIDSIKLEDSEDASVPAAVFFFKQLLDMLESHLEIAKKDLVLCCTKFPLNVLLNVILYSVINLAI